jgi:diaminopropionate ammonia-lyase
MLDGLPFSVFANPRRGVPGVTVLTAAGYRRAKAAITAWSGYAPTALRDLPGLAAAGGIGVLRLKDEASRFGLGSFKALGGAYAVGNLLCQALARGGVAASTADLDAGIFSAATQRVTLTCATDGNHGRAVAWGAQRFHARCVIFVHDTVSRHRAAAIEAYGATVQWVPGTYDDALRACSREAAAQGWLVVSDTSWPGYTEVPRDIMQGYRLMADEAADQWDGAPPTHVFIQAGVGAAAASVSVQCRARWSPAPALVVVEPDRAACLLASARTGALTAVGGALDTIMAGLACGEPSLLAWQELERGSAAFMAIPDAAAVATMRRLAAQGIVAGESGVAGLAGLLLAAADPAARSALGLDAASRVLAFSTEGATDPALYAELVDAA